MMQKMNLITFLVFLYAGIVCAVMKPDTHNNSIVKNNSNDTILVKPVSGRSEVINSHTSVSSKTLFVHGVH